MKLKYKQIKTLLLTISALLVSIQLIAQNHLYTTEQYGIDGAILGGAVTSGCGDVSMIYYNPASIHKVSSQINISLIQPSIRTFGFNEFWMNDENSRPNTSARLKSTLVSFKFKIKKLNLAFLKLNRSEFEDTFDATQEFTTNNLLTTQYFDYEYSGRDNWYGVGTNFKLSKNLYFGVSQFISIARFTYKNTILLEEINTNQEDELTQYFSSTFDGTYRSISLITKLGLLLDTEKHDLGFTITTPNYLPISTGGRFFKANISSEGESTNVEQVIDNNISPTIKTPWEFNFGYSLALSFNKKVWLNSSYHTGIGEYDMVDKASDDANITWKNGSKAILNFSFAYSQDINPYIQVSGGIRTNNFAYENKLSPQGAVRNIIFDGNHLHFVLGTKLNFNRSTFLLGIDYGSIQNVPDKENFLRLSNLGTIGPNLGDLQKTNLSILLTYRFIIDEIKKLGTN